MAKYPNSRNKNLHVVREGDGQWAVAVEGTGRILHYATQSEAIRVAMRLARRLRVLLYLHSAEGQILARNDFAVDAKAPTFQSQFAA